MREDSEVTPPRVYGNKTPTSSSALALEFDEQLVIHRGIIEGREKRKIGLERWPSD